MLGWRPGPALHSHLTRRAASLHVHVPNSVTDWQIFSYRGRSQQWNWCWSRENVQSICQTWRMVDFLQSNTRHNETRSSKLVTTCPYMRTMQFNKADSVSEPVWCLHYSIMMLVYSQTHHLWAAVQAHDGKAETSQRFHYQTDGSCERMHAQL